MSKINKVHIVFKTHLDIGFTDLAQNAVNKYFELFIPKSIELAEQLKLESSSAQFVWTTGSWLIHEYLKQATSEQKRELNAAIAAGSIVWHGLPFTTSTELMDATLFEYGLSISQRLDARYGKKTIAAKMTDVPGHTIGMVRYLAKFGIQYLHLGVNPASKVPSVPEIFVWKAKDGSEVIVNYAKSYGNFVEIDGLDEVMVFAHTGDNTGPPSISDVQTIFEQLSERYPGASIEASTMDAFAEKLMALKDSFPVVYEEIGDTWIHGVGSDPTKVSQYRELLRLRDKWVHEGRLDTGSQEYSDFCDQLILIPEHTWGMDEKKFLTDFKNYSIRDFHAARQVDIVAQDAIPDKYRHLGYFTLNEAFTSELPELVGGEKTFSYFESSWKEQREYIQLAVRALSEDKQQEAIDALEALVPTKDSCLNGQGLQIRQRYELGAFLVEFEIDGSICRLVDKNGKTWADEQHRLGSFQYETFGIDHYNHWSETYIENWSQTHFWADADFGKPGMEFAEPRPEHRLFSPTVIQMVTDSNDQYDLVQIRMCMPSESYTESGAPRELRIKYKFFKHVSNIEAEVSWFNKQANRLPEASWFSFGLNVDNPNLWKLDKLGELISPLEVVKNGNRYLHAINSGVYYHGSDGKAVIETLDAPLVAPGEKRLLRFDQSFAPLDGGMHFNLHNNVWGTNYQMWYEEDAKFRFSIRLD